MVPGTSGGGAVVVGAADEGCTDAVDAGAVGVEERDVRGLADRFVGVIDTENDGVSGTKVGSVGTSASAPPPRPDDVSAASATPSTSAMTMASTTTTGDTAGRMSCSSSTASSTSSTVGSTAAARTATRSSIASRASSGIATIGSPAASRRPFAIHSTTSSHAEQLLRCRRCGTVCGAGRVPSASPARVPRSAGVRPLWPARLGTCRSSYADTRLSRPAPTSSPARSGPVPRATATACGGRS
jgi:hypothetical protein